MGGIKKKTPTLSILTENLTWKSVSPTASILHLKVVFSKGMKELHLLGEHKCALSTRLLDCQSLRVKGCISYLDFRLSRNKKGALWKEVTAAGSVEKDHHKHNDELVRRKEKLQSEKKKNEWGKKPSSACSGFLKMSRQLSVASKMRSASEVVLKKRFLTFFATPKGTKS